MGAAHVAVDAGVAVATSSGSRQQSLNDKSNLSELATVRDWLRYAVTRFKVAKLFFGHGTRNAYDEAAYLILHALHLPLDRLEPFLDARLLESERRVVLDLIRRRVDERIPAAYLTREAWLGDFRFYVDERVIVPRSYFAELLEDGLAPWVSDPDKVKTALDMCTGSGCLAILMAHAYRSAQVDAADISTDALAVARRNVAEYGLEERVRVEHSDLFQALEGRRYDLIVCNPPYVTKESMRKLPAEYRHEPRLALAAGDDGLNLVRRLLAEARRYLSPKGILAVEIGHNRELVEAAFPETAFTWLDAGNDEGTVFVLQRRQLG